MNAKIRKEMSEMDVELVDARTAIDIATTEIARGKEVRVQGNNPDGWDTICLNDPEENYIRGDPLVDFRAYLERQASYGNGETVWIYLEDRVLMFRRAELKEIHGFDKGWDYKPHGFIKKPKKNSNKIASATIVLNRGYTNCKKCRNRHDCWIRAAKEGRIPVSSGHEIKLVTEAMQGNCPLFVDKNEDVWEDDWE